MKIVTLHELVGKTLGDINELDMGSYYPVLGVDDDIIIGVFDAHHGTPKGYILSDKLQAYVIVAGRKLSETSPVDLDGKVPVLGSDRDTILRLIDSEFDAPDGYEFASQLSAFVRTESV